MRKDITRVSKSTQDQQNHGSRISVAIEYVGMIAIACLFAGAVIGWSVAPRAASTPTHAPHAAGMDAGMGGMENPHVDTIGPTPAALQQIENEADWGTLVDIGNHAYDQGRPEVAIAAYEKALRIKPDDENVMTDLSAMYIQADNPTKAVELARKAIEINANHPQSRYWLGMALAATGDKSGARKALQEVKKISPGSELAAEAEKQLGLLGTD